MAGWKKKKNKKPTDAADAALLLFADKPHNLLYVSPRDGRTRLPSVRAILRTTLPAGKWISNMGALCEGRAVRI